MDEETQDILSQYVTAVFEGRLGTADFLHAYLEPVDLSDMKTPQTEGPSMSGTIGTSR